MFGAVIESRAPGQSQPEKKRATQDTVPTVKLIQDKKNAPSPAVGMLRIKVKVVVRSIGRVDTVGTVPYLPIYQQQI